MKSIVVVLCALAAATPAARARAGERSSDGYAFSWGETVHSSNIDLDQLLRLRKERRTDFLWFRRGGRAYVVTDEAILAAGRDILRPLQELAREQEQVSARLKPFEEQEAAIDREEDRLDQQAERLEERDDHVSAEERRRLETRQRELDARRRPVEERIREIEADEQSLEDREDAAERVADAQVAGLIDEALRRGLARPVR